jgi:inosine/xanthosine triphosphate pyrophosphatase family protein
MLVFVTGNAGKLREVREILALAQAQAGSGTPIEIESRDLDRECELAAGLLIDIEPSHPFVLVL